MNGNLFIVSRMDKVVHIVMCIVFCVFIGMPTTFAQYLKAGDRFPDLKINHVDNWEGGEIDFSTLRGKLVVLDFWTVYCVACINDMPKMESLQNEFGSSVQIVLVTSSSREQVENLKKRSETLRSVKLPMIIGDTLLNNLFSFRLVPTHVWIDEDGMVTQVTGPYTTYETLTAHFSGNTVEFVQSKEYKDFDVLSPLLKEGGGRQLPHIRQYAAIFAKIDDDVGFWGVIVDPKTRKVIGNKMINQPITQLYGYAYATDLMPFDQQNGRIILEVANPERFILPKGITHEAALWRRDNAYCYESYLPNAKPGDLKRAMKLALDQYFGLPVAIEEREVDCYVLYNRDEHKFRNIYNLQIRDGRRPKTFKQFCDEIRMEICEIGKPMIVEFEFEGNIFVEVPRFNGDLNKFSNKLSKYGLELRQEKRRLDMLIIR